MAALRKIHSKLHLLYPCECCPYQGIEIPVDAKRSSESIHEPVKCECGIHFLAHVEESWPGKIYDAVSVHHCAADRSCRGCVATLKIVDKEWNRPGEITFWRAPCPECQKTMTFKNQSRATCYSCQKDFELDYDGTLGQFLIKDA